MLELAPASIQNATELLNIQSSSKPDEIVALHQSMKDLDLLVVHESGLFHRWGLETEALEAEYKFSASRRTGVNFNADGSQVITPGKLVSEELLYGYSVWDVNTGEILECWGDHCPNPTTFDERVAQWGVALSPNGEWIFEYRGQLAYSAILTDPPLFGGGSIVDPDDFDNKYYTIDQIAIDQSSIYIAIAIEEGILIVYDIDNRFSLKGELKPLNEQDPRNVPSGSLLYRRYGRYDDKNPMYTSDLAIDDTRTWLARLTDKELIIYDLRKRFFPRHMKIPISNGNLLAFNHSGNLLAVATDEELIMFDLAKRKQVASFQTGEATALFFTHDDRLLTWGDKDGMIHIWGVKKNDE
jgi:WD40 repeat protein